MPRLALPSDDSVQLGQMLQWWYWSGHLSAPGKRHFGFEIVFFAIDLELLWVQMAQAAITDITGQRFYLREETWFEKPKSLPDGFELSARKESIAAFGSNGHNQLQSVVEGHQLDLTVETGRPPVAHYHGFPQPYSFGGYTYYYSRPLMQAKGTLALPGGERLPVEGTAWFDRQFGDLGMAVYRGWQWFSLQLDDGTEIMLFDFNRSHRDNYGSITNSHWHSRDLGADDFSVEVLQWWRSPESHIDYPHRWRVKVPGYDLEIVPEVENQELSELIWLGPRYWEGACRVTGTVTGRAYVELNGFGYGGPAGDLIQQSRRSVRRLSKMMNESLILGSTTAAAIRQRLMGLIKLP